MPTITKTLLAGTNNDGFANVSHNFTNFGVASGVLAAEKLSANPGDGGYNGTVRQGPTQNRYSDWGVPAGAVILGLRVISISGSVTSDAGGTLDASVQFWTDEADLGTKSFNALSDGAYTDVSASNLTANSYVRVQVDISNTINFSEGGYGDARVEITDFQVEVTYEIPKKSGMFFGV